MKSATVTPIKTASLELVAISNDGDKENPKEDITTMLNAILTAQAQMIEENRKSREETVSRVARVEEKVDALVKIIRGNSSSSSSPCQVSRQTLRGSSTKNIGQQMYSIRSHNQ